MKVLVDINVIIDSLVGRKPFIIEADQIFELCSQGAFEAFVTANMMTDIYYILRKNMSVDAAKGYMSYLLDFFRIIPVRRIECKLALGSQNSDFEDALLEICASMSGMEYIITRDGEFQKNCPFAISLQAFLIRLQNS